MSKGKHFSDNLLFTLRPSQWTNFGWLMFAAVGHPLILPVVILVWRWAVVHFWRFDFRERTIGWRKGVFSVTAVEVHYYRVKSVMVEKPFLMRLVGLSNIYVLTSDPYLPQLKLWAIQNGSEIEGIIRENVNYWRQMENVRELDHYALRSV